MEQNSQTAMPDIRQTIEINAPIQKVWDAVATSEGIAAWFMPNDFKPEVGYEFHLNAGPYGMAPCKVTELDPPNRLSFFWTDDWHVTFELKELDGKTEFTLIHSGWDEEKATEFGESHLIVRDRMNGGWAGLVKKLAGYVEGEKGTERVEPQTHALQDIRHTYVLKAPIEKVWDAVATSEGLAAWLMSNDFQPELGHEFMFRSQPMGDWDGTVRCKVTEIDQPYRLGFTWNGNDMSTYVSFELEEIDGNTQVTLVHSGWTEEHAMTRRILDEGWGKKTKERLAELVEG